MYIKHLSSFSFSGLNKLSGFEGRSVACYILKTKCSITQNYGYIRGNDIQSLGPSKPELQDLLYISEGLRHDGVSDAEVLCVTEKYAKTLMFRSEEITALRKIVAWKKAERENLMTVLKKYESYCTLDINNQRNKTRRMMGRKMMLPRSLFTEIGKVSGKDFLEQSKQVLDGDRSLKDLVKDLQTVHDLEKSRAIVSQAANYTPISELKSTYPGKFDDEVLSKFKGATRSPTTKNQPGYLLEKYVKSVVADTATVTEGSVKAIIVENIIQVDQELITNSDVIVCNLKSVPSIVAENLMTLGCSRAKDGFAVMLLMPDRNAQVWCLRELGKYMDGNFIEVQIDLVFLEKSKFHKEYLKYL